MCDSARVLVDVHPGGSVETERYLVSVCTVCVRGGHGVEEGVDGGSLALRARGQSVSQSVAGEATAMVTGE